MDRFGRFGATNRKAHHEDDQAKFAESPLIITHQISHDEPELLAGREHLTLRFRSSIDGEELSVLSAPDGGWTHHLLESAPRPSNGAAWDAFLGPQWIGSSEV